MMAKPMLGRRSFSIAHLLVVLILLFVTRPIFEDTQIGDLVELIVGTLVLLTSVLAVGGKKTTLIAGLVLAVPAIIGTWINHLRPDTFSGYLRAITTLVFVGFVWWQLFRFILRSPRVTSEVLCAGVANYLLLALFWATIDSLVERIFPGSFRFMSEADRARGLKGFMALYFTLSTFTTVTFGDIVPISNLARMLTMLQAMSAMFYMAIMIARLVALYTTEDAEENTKKGDPIDPPSAER